MNSRNCLKSALILAFLALTFISCEKEEDIDNYPIKDLRDGNVYQTVTIGSQVWMAENLNYDAVNGSWAYGNNTSFTDSYGRLYNWETACNVCPDGWHLPSDAEWTELTDYLGGDNIAGGKLKETGTNHWISPNTGATNKSGFTALPGGYRAFYTPFPSLELGYTGIFWSATEYDSSSSYIRRLDSGDSQVNGYDLPNDFGFSVRCVKD